MNLNTSTTPAAIGAAFGGGFFFGIIKEGADTFAMIVAPKAAGEMSGEWLKTCASIPDAESYSNGRANTEAMAAAGSALAIAVLSLEIDGLTDWAIPSRDELELLYRNLKPTNSENSESFRDGDNPSSSPVGYPYTATGPTQTTVAAFQAGGAEALEPSWHWSSTQYAPLPNYAWYQGFFNGYQLNFYKSSTGRARAVRRLIIQ